ncbi:hypothetical protein [Treponema sp. C6A8]|uniref:hypothetical protein n=1 Tax=Treponema sp. C6A8 TaxID=1410609 RepID=UPI000484AFC1|nr:hypothetical protein [Treponema sp. C6A8]
MESKKINGPTFEDYISGMKGLYNCLIRDDRPVNEKTPEYCKYWEAQLLYAMKYATYSEVMYSFLAKNLQKALKDGDFEKARVIMYQATFLEHAETGSTSGYDHSGRFLEVMKYASCLGLDVLYRCFPNDVPFSNNGYPITTIIVNLLICIMYNTAESKKYDEESIVLKAEKRLTKKSDKAFCGVLMCLLGILKHDVGRFNEGLQIAVSNWNRQEINETEKVLCQAAVTLIMIAKKFMSPEEFSNIEYPEAKNFSRKYLEYILSQASFEPKAFYEFPDELAPINSLMLLPIPLTQLYKPYENRGGYTKREREGLFLDCERMVIDFVLDYRKNYNV